MIEIHGIWFSCGFIIFFYINGITLFYPKFQAVSFVEEIFVRLANISLPQRNLPSNDDYADATRKRQKLKKAQ